MLVLAMTLAAGALPVRAMAEPPVETSNERSDAGPHLLNGVTVAACVAAVSLLLTVALLLVPNRAMRTRREVEDLVRRQAAALQEEDRRRIAQELHDGAGQALTAAHLQLEALRSGSTDPAKLDLVIRLVENAMDEIRRSTQALAPPMLAELGLREALCRHCEVFAAATRLKVSFDVPETLPRLPAPVEIACYRIAQEALQNVARHADATSAQVKLRCGAQSLSLEIEDDGVGLESDEEAIGLRSIRERAFTMNAQVAVHRGTDGGLRLQVTFPESTVGARS